MLNSITQKQLDKLGLVMPPDTDTAMIMKGSIDSVGKSFKFEVGHSYRIVFEKYIVEPYEGFTLHYNYNNGTHPKYKDVDCYIEEISASGKMVRMNTRAVTTGELWDGWVPVSSCNIMGEINQ